jgi:hypothetical protein
MENGGIINDHWEYLAAIWHNLWPFGTVCGHLVYISRLDQEKSGNPGLLLT